MYDTALPHFPLLSTNFGVTWALQNPWASQNPGAPGVRAYLTDPEEKLFHDLGRWGWRQNPGPIFLEFPTSSMPNLLELRFWAGSSNMNFYRQRNRPQNQEKTRPKKTKPSSKSARKRHINPQQYSRNHSTPLRNLQKSPEIPEEHPTILQMVQAIIKNHPNS